MIIVGVIACTFCLAACGDNDDKKVISLFMADDNGAEFHSVLHYMGDIVYGSKPDLDSFKLYAEHLDGSNTEIDKTDSRVSVRYSYNLMDIAALPDFYDVGTYTVIYSYEHCEVGVMFKVVTSATETP